MAKDLHELTHQATRIADELNGTNMSVTQEEALKAWDLRMYETEFLEALGKLGIEVI